MTTLTSRPPRSRLRSPLQALHTVAFAAVLATSLAAQQTQPTNVTPLHRSGQTFLTWTENAVVTGETYRIYRHTAPITTQNLPTTALFEVTEQSGRFFADLHNGTPRFFKSFVVDNQTELSSGTGLLVWTMNTTDLPGGTPATHHYAVTIVHQGTENRTITTNASVGVRETIARPQHVLGKRDPSGRGHAFIQYMDLRNWNETFDAPNPTNQFYGLSNVPGAPQYAYTYSVQEPSSGAGPFPLWIELHHFDDHTAGDIVPYPPALGVNTPILVRPVDPGNSWWFGFEATTDYRAGTPTGASGQTVRNFTEHRILRMILDLCKDPVIGPRIDPNRIFVSGFSMGGSGALSLATRYPSLFAAAFADKPVTSYLNMSDLFVNHNEDVWGPIASGLPVELLPSPSTWGCHLPSRGNGTNIWKWQDHRSQSIARRRDEFVPFGINHGTADRVLLWVNQGQPFYAGFNGTDRCYGGVSTSSGHQTESVGMPPTLAHAAWPVFFQQFRIVRDETVPGLANASSDVNQPMQIAHNQDVEWCASWTSSGWSTPPVDLVGTWEISLRASSDTTVDVTPRRTQAFHVDRGTVYSWTNTDLASGTVVASGTVTGDPDGLVTVPSFQVTQGGNRVKITRTNPYTLAVSNPLVTGTNGTLTIANATPNSSQAVQATLAGIDVHLIPITQTSNVLFRLCQPAPFAALTADAFGNATHSFPVLDSTLGASVWFQVLEHPSLRTSNLVRRVVQ